jgi:hypothetical protein
MDLFAASGEYWEKPTLLDQFERANLNHCLPRPTPEDGNREFPKRYVLLCV